MRAIFYHGLVERRDAADFAAHNALTVEEFSAHAVELAKNWKVLSLADVADHIRDGRKLPPRSVHVSFDDGFRNNLRVAEIMDRHRLPWTLFVVADAILDGFQPWYIRLSDAIRATNHPVRLDGERFDLGQIREKYRFKTKLKERVLSAPAAVHLELLEDLLGKAGLVRPESSNWPFLNESELKELAAAHVEIGGHTATHPNLTQCSAAELSHEIAGSKARIDEVVGFETRFFSYPDGRYDRNVIAAVSGSYELAMATDTTMPPLSRYQIRRYAVAGGAQDLRRVLAAGYPFRSRIARAQRMTKRRLRTLVDAVIPRSRPSR